jgi:hypothetical protein
LNAVFFHAEPLVSLFVCLPGGKLSWALCKSLLTRITPLTLAVAVLAWVRNVEAEHAEHIEHLKKENDGHLPEVAAYDYLNKRVKPYPWGPNSLFFNPHVCI